jgi:SAM-dependent methyltransferase
MGEQFEKIKLMYGESFHLHGDSPASLLTPKGRNELRFRAIDPFLDGPDDKSVLDYGCGLGYFFEYLRGRGSKVSYYGMDVMPEFIEACIKKCPTDATFQVIEPEAPIAGHYDIVFSSGVFNLQTHLDEDESKAYAFERIKQLFGAANQVFVCDFLSAFVDYRQPEGQHFTIQEISEFCFRDLSRRFVVRHDLLPYEFTLIAWKDSEIKRPENIYMADCSSAPK